MLFAQVVAAYPVLKGRFPKKIESNYSPGRFVPAEKVPGLLTWVERRVRGYSKPDRRLFRGLILVLKQAAELKLAYWEGTELPVPSPATIMSPAEQRRADLEEVPSPDGIYLDCVGQADSIVAFAHGVGFPRDCRTALADMSTWPPRFTFSNEYALSARRSRQGCWVTTSMIDDHPYLYRVRRSDRPDGEKTPLLPPDERENGVWWANFLGERIIAVLRSREVYPEKILLPAYPLLEQEERLVPVERLQPSTERFPTFGVARLNDAGDVFIWDGDGYELREGCFELVFNLKARWSLNDGSPMTPFGLDGFFFLSNRELYSVRRGQPPVRHLPTLNNIMAVAPGPSGGILITAGGNTLGDLGKLYFPEQDVFLRIEPELFEDEDPDEIRSIHWAASCNRIVAATSKRLWAVPAERVLVLPRDRASDGKKLRGAP